MRMECAADAPPFPQRITLELTNRCNLQCGFCPRKYMEPERGDMDVALAKRLIDEMALHAPVQLVPFFRGETLLHPHWHEILAHAKACGCGPIQLASNATRLTPETGAALLATGLDFVSFSLNPPDPRAQAAPERTADYATCRDNVLAFLDRKAKCGAKTVVQVSTVETQSRSPQVQDFVAFWREKADRVRIYVEHSGDGHPGSIAEPLPAFDRRQPCKKLFSDMVVYWNGAIAVCNHDWTRQVNGRPLASVRHASLAEAWNAPAYNALRQSHRRGDYAGTDVCRHCDHWKMYYLEDGFLGRLYLKGEQA